LLTAVNGCNACGLRCAACFYFAHVGFINAPNVGGMKAVGNAKCNPIKLQSTCYGLLSLI